jgi:CheY-like chemotaxis protein/HPt (histidine-containing phosphotransfer) domain-containing protein/anti-sigma regulatory factor (Ser/Thr protein kinase)
MHYIHIESDPGRIRQIFTNLINNAIKFTSEGEIVIKIKQHIKDDKCTLKCSIQDTGIGIPKNKIHKLFQSFSQVDASTTRVFGGTGLGLAIVKQLCNLLEGDIKVESEEGKGSCFTFTIETKLTKVKNPANHYDENYIKLIDKEKSISLSLSDKQNKTSIHAKDENLKEGCFDNDDLNDVGFDKEKSASDIKILLVDDNIINQEVALGILNQFGYEADVAANGLEAIETLNKSNYHLVLMDCQMPIMDGYNATQKIRTADKPYSKIPIIAMTANAMKGDKEKCIDSGMNDYLSKPIEPESLRDILQKWADKAKCDQSDDIEVSTVSSNTIWDSEGFKKRVMNNEAIAQKLLDLFKTDTPKTIQQLEEAISLNKTDDAGKLAHKLKGSVANIGGLDLADLASKIEVAGREDDMTKVQELWPNIRSEYNKLLSVIEANQ